METVRNGSFALWYAVKRSGRRAYQIASAADIHTTRFSLILNGLTEPRQDERERIARALGATEAELFNDAPRPEAA